MTETLHELITPETVIANLAAKDQRNVLLELVSVLTKQNPDLNRDEIVKALLEREADGTTGIGNGIAIPHIRSDLIPSVLLVIGRSATGIDFDALDNKPVHLFFLLLSPESNDYLKTLARISRVCQDPKFYKGIMQAEGVTEILAILENR